MLSELSIENFAIIEHLVLRFDPGLTVLTGETGAGKSIIVDALQSALGARVSSDVVRGGSRSATVEAVFDFSGDPDEELYRLLSELGIEFDGQMILRRDISTAGRGTARVNGRAVPLSTLSAVGATLVDIHGQSDHLSILRRDRQLDVLDRFGGLLDLRSQVATALKEFGRVRRELQALSAGQQEAEWRLDLLRFQVGEIEGAQLAVGEEEDLTAERNRLVNAERLVELSHAARESVRDHILEHVAVAASSLRDLTAIDPALVPLYGRVEGAQYELDDIADELRRYADQISFDPQRLAALEERLDLIARLKRKYGSSVEAILEFGAGARAEMEDVENLDEKLSALGRELERVEESAGSLAADLSASRLAAAEHLAGAAEPALQGLGLRNTAFRIAVSQVEREDGIIDPSSGRRFGYTTAGIDSVAFLVSFNPGEELRPLEGVASGGETSRFLLALKSVLSDSDRIPTLIFDEVDVGVGGRHGTVVGERLRGLAQSHQVLSITHLPQVAALGDHHLTVTKAVAAGRSTVAIRYLEGADRVVEIAEMMSGTGTETARRNAEELLASARNG